ncbi:MAG: TIGR02302 family protein [Beijerinckiaceae bacterium]|nr:TIGR02302 family protein [Beijerinckiaceae bacterium]
MQRDETRRNPTEMASTGGEPRGGASAIALLAGRLSRARAAAFVELAWPLLVPLLALTFAFLALAWVGFFALAPIWLRMASVAVFALAVLICLFRLRGLRWPSVEVGLARLDRDSLLLHRPVRTATDRLGNGGDDPTTVALWRLHQARAEARLSEVKVTPPKPEIARRDPNAWRFAAFLAAFAAFFVAGPEWEGRLLSAFDWTTPSVAPAPPRIDAWIDPPAYTGRPPIFLSRADRQPGDGVPIAVPVGSTLVLRATPADGISIDKSGALEAKEPAKDEAGKSQPGAAKAASAAPSGSLEQRFTIAGDGGVSIRDGGREIVGYKLKSIPDLVPRVEILGTERTAKGDGLTLRYRVEDDYGIVSGESVFEPLPSTQPTKDGKPRRTLGEAPKLPLSVPATSGTPAEGEASADLSEHPWAGAKVRLQLKVKDDLGQVGVSQPVEVVIPQKPFSEPLAKALVEQRRAIVMNPDDKLRPMIALDALLTEPEAFGTSVAVYTGLKIAASRLKAARSDQQLQDVADWLWEMALQIEDGGLSKAEKALRAAQERLREAIERGASPDEIKRLAEDLKRAMDRYMREFAEKNRNGKQNAERDPNAKMLSQDDLRKILEKIEELTRNGQLAEAQRLLEKLNEMMRNLQTAEGGGGDGQDQRNDELSQQADELDKLTRDEQRLRDRTYREGQERQRGQQQGQGQQSQQGRQGGRQQGQQSQSGRGQQGQRQQGQGQQGQQGQQGPGQQGQGQQGQNQGQGSQPGDGQLSQDGGGGTLENRQQRLREQLGRLQRRLKELGAEGEDSLADAEQAMRDSEQALKNGQNGQAVDSQGKALDSLRKGARNLAQQLQKGDGSDQAEGTDQAGRPNGAAQGLDPLGRSPADRNAAQNGGQNNARLNADGRGGGTIEERARAVLDELRRRLGEPYRPQVELDYFERLLRGN